MSNNQPLVSVAMITYGHEKYIQKALDSILMQKVNFKYEIVVGEDCSPDKTREILKEYEKEFPDKFIMIYHSENVGADANEQDVFRRCRGKYIAFLEGDDYWTSDQKLQKQVDYMESHDDCIATAHWVEVVDEAGNRKKERYPQFKKRNYTFKHYRKSLMPGQTASLVTRNIYNNDDFDLHVSDDNPLEPGDRVIIFVLATYGKIYCFPEVMSAYRHVTSGGNSYSATRPQKIDPMIKINYYRALMKYAKRLGKNQEAIKTAEILYFFVVARSLKYKEINLNFVRNAALEINHKAFAILFLFYQMVTWPVRYYIFKRDGI